jgi:hypothetical protein
MPEKSLEARSSAARKAVSDLGGLYPTKKTGFRASTLRLLEDFANLRGRLSKIDIQFGIPTRTTNSGVNSAGNFLSSLRILTSRISMACSDQCWRPSRGALITNWST